MFVIDRQPKGHGKRHHCIICKTAGAREQLEICLLHIVKLVYRADYVTDNSTEHHRINHFHSQTIIGLLCTKLSYLYQKEEEIVTKYV